MPRAAGNVCRMTSEASTPSHGFRVYRPEETRPSSYFKVRGGLGKGSIRYDLVEEDEGLPVQLLVDHHREDAHLGGAAVVQLLRPQVDHLLLGPRVRPESDGERRGAEVAGEGSLLLLPGEFQQAGGQE